MYNNNIIQFNMKKINRVIYCQIILAFLISTTISVNAQTISSREVDSLVERTLKTFNVPGIAVAVVKDDKVIHAKGYGVRSVESGRPVDANTLFGIASNSKAFTVAALGILVDEGKLSWDSKVNDIIPEFRLYNPYVTEEFTIRDMLTHRSGLGLGAGDLMIWPGPNDFTKEEIIYNLRYLKQASGFRTKYDYDNLMYIVAGEVVKRVSGMSWEDFIETRIMQPLNMTGSAASYHRLKDYSNVIDPHIPVNGVITPIERHTVEISNSAGGIYSNITDMSKWVIMQMNNGKYGDKLSKQIFSEKVHSTMWSPQTIIQGEGSYDYNTHFNSYGLGWHLSDVNGYKKVEHTGALAGMVTQVLMIPELKLGIIVLTNQQSEAAFYAISNTILDKYFGIKGKDRVKEYNDAVINTLEYAKKITDKVWGKIEEQQLKNTLKPDYSLCVGRYNDIWFGDVTIFEKEGKLRYESKRCPKLSGDLIPFKDKTFIVKWDDRSLDADAFIYFETDKEGQISGMTMEPISPLTDFSYDFQDLNFSRNKGQN
jgi:CubicO group peptidase (beta-lactamase class C family)